MKKDKVVKIMMSAAVMASVATAPAMAEDERPAEADMVQAIDTEEDSQTAQVEEESAGMEAECVVGRKGEVWSEQEPESTQKAEWEQEAETTKIVEQEREPESTQKAKWEQESETTETVGQEWETETTQKAEREQEAESVQVSQEGGTENEAREAVYQTHSSFSGGPGVVKWQNPVKEPVQEYGPHCVSLIQDEKAEEEDMQQELEETAPSYTEEDLYILAHAICGEGQCYPDDEQLYIGSVILNRKNHSAYPDTIKGVVFQKGQYACTWDGNYYREPTEANWRNARWLLENGSILPGNVVYQAGFRQGNGLYLQTRYHKYCYRS